MIRRNKDKIYILFLIICFAIGVASASEHEIWRKDKLCSQRLNKAEETKISGCFSAYCIKISADSRICSCLPSADSDDAKFFIEKNGKTIRQWDDQMYPPAGAEAFRVDTADITGGGKKDLLVATMWSASQGMGVTTWSVRAIVGDIVSNPVVIDDYGVLGFATQSEKDNRCNLLITEWVDGWEPKRGDGLYLVGKWFALNKTAKDFYVVSDRPSIYRRYLYTFQRLRNNAMGKETLETILWFTDKDAKPLLGAYPKLKYNDGQQGASGDRAKLPPSP